MQRALLPILLALPPLACATGGEGSDLAASLPPAVDASPLAGWEEVSPFAFEKLVESALPEGEVTELDEFLLGACERALDQAGPNAVRAAVLLGRSGSDAAGAMLIARLERRVLGPARTSDAGDCTAAAALVAFPDPERWADRLVVLAGGTGDAAPHPDLEVRTECAVSALARGRDEVIPFLLAVLRIGTDAGEDDERDFAVSDTTAWVRGRAALALSRRAEVPVTYRTDAPLGDREAETEELRRTLDALGALD